MSNSATAVANDGSRTTAAVPAVAPSASNSPEQEWIEAQREELLDTQYFHVVFTVSDEIAAIAFQNASTVYKILFHAAAETLRTIAADRRHLGAEIGFFAVLHTWGQNLS
jgi:hypothetical protein